MTHTQTHAARCLYDGMYRNILERRLGFIFVRQSPPPPAGPLQVFNLFKIARFEMRRDEIKCLVRDKLCFFVNVSMVNDSMMME